MRSALPPPLAWVVPFPLRAAGSVGGGLQRRGGERNPTAGCLGRAGLLVPHERPGAVRGGSVPDDAGPARAGPRPAGQPDAEPFPALGGTTTASRKPTAPKGHTADGSFTMRTSLGSLLPPCFDEPSTKCIVHHGIIYSIIGRMQFLPTLYLKKISSYSCIHCEISKFDEY